MDKKKKQVPLSNTLAPIAEEAAGGSNITTSANSLIQSENAKEAEIKYYEEKIKEQNQQMISLRKTKNELRLQIELRKKYIQEEHNNMDNFIERYEAVNKKRDAIIGHGCAIRKSCNTFNKTKDFLLPLLNGIGSQQTGFMGLAVRARNMISSINDKLDKTEKAVREDWEAKMQESTQEISTQKEKNATLLCQIKNVSETNRINTERLKNIKISNENLDKRIAEGTIENKKIREALERSRYLDEQNVKAKVEKAEEEMKLQKDEMEHKMNELDLQKDEFLEKIKVLSSEMDDIIAQNEKLKSANEVSKAQLREAKEKKSELITRRGETNLRVDSLLQEKSNTLIEIEELDKTILGKTNQLENLKEDNDKLAKEVYLKKLENQETMKTLFGSKEKSLVLEEKVAQKEAAVEELKQKIDALKKEYETLDGNQKKAEVDEALVIAALTEKLSLAENEKNESQQRMNQLNINLDNARLECEEKENELHLLEIEAKKIEDGLEVQRKIKEEELPLLVEKLKQIVDEVDNLKIEKSSVQNKIETVKESISAKKIAQDNTLKAKKDALIKSARYEQSQQEAAALEAEVNELRSACKKEEISIENAQKQLDKATKERAVYEARLRDQEARRIRIVELTGLLEAAEMENINEMRDISDSMIAMKESYGGKIRLANEKLEEVKALSEQRAKEFEISRIAIAKNSDALEEARQSLCKLKSLYSEKDIELETEREKLSQMKEEENRRKLEKEAKARDEEASKKRKVDVGKKRKEQAKAKKIDGKKDDAKQAWEKLLAELPEKENIKPNAKNSGRAKKDTPVTGATIKVEKNQDVFDYDATEDLEWQSGQTAPPRKRFFTSRGASNSRLTYNFKKPKPDEVYNFDSDDSVEVVAVVNKGFHKKTTGHGHAKKETKKFMGCSRTTMED